MSAGFAARSVATVFFAFSMLTAARLAWADLRARENTPESLRRAALLAPNAAYLERLAEIEADDAQSRDPAISGEIENLHAALGINPRSSAAWIALGLATERAREPVRSGDFLQARAFPEAESHLLKAAQIDRQYLPAWTLANFYFRRGDRASFCKWATRAAELCYDDPRPLIALADRLAPGQALELLSSPIAASRAKFERAYLDLLIGAGRMDDAQAVARRMLERIHAGGGLDLRARSSDSASDAGDDALRLRALTTRLVAANRGGEALEIWNGLPAAGLNGSSSGEGFDWRVLARKGVSCAQKNSMFDCTLDENHPGSFPVIERPIAILKELAGRKQRVLYQYRTGVAGFHWAFEMVAEMAAEPGVRAIESPVLPSSPKSIELQKPEWRTGEWAFVAPHKFVPNGRTDRVALGRLTLFYRREFDRTRSFFMHPQEGRLELRNLRIEIEEAAP